MESGCSFVAFLVRMFFFLKIGRRKVCLFLLKCFLFGLWFCFSLTSFPGVYANTVGVVFRFVLACCLESPEK